MEYILFIEEGCLEASGESFDSMLWEIRTSESDTGNTYINFDIASSIQKAWMVCFELKENGERFYTSAYKTKEDLFFFVEDSSGEVIPLPFSSEQDVVLEEGLVIKKEDFEDISKALNEYEY